MSNIIKSDSIFLCEEKKYIFNARRKVVAYSSNIKRAEKEQKIEMHIEEIKKQAEKQAEQTIDKAEKRARNIIEEAESSAQAILEKARKEGYEEGTKKGYKKGYEDGLAEGREKGESEYQDSINKANSVKDEYNNLREMLYQSCEQDMVRLAISIARRIIDIRTEDDEKAYLSIAQKTLTEVKGQKGIQLRCSSRDYPIAAANKELLISMVDGLDDIVVVEDMFLNKGSCIVETDGGGVDGSIDTQMDNIKNVFISILRESVKE